MGEGTGENLRGLGTGEIGSSLSRAWKVLTTSFTLERFCSVASLGGVSWEPESLLDMAGAFERERRREGGRKEGEREGEAERGREEEDWKEGGREERD